jgi:hypothetical protein
MQFDEIGTDFLPILPSVPEGGMIYYLQTSCTLRGRAHQNTFFLTFNGGEKSVAQFFSDNTQTIMLRLLLMQSWDVFMLGYWFVKLFPPPYVIQFVPFPQFGFWAEPAAPSKDLAIVSMKTEQTGPKSRGRKFLFGLPATWVDGNQLTTDAVERIASRVSTWEQLYHPDYTDWPYTMGLMHRYVDGVKHSPLVPFNYWPFERMLVRVQLVKHRHVRRSSRWPVIT